MGKGLDTHPEWLDAEAGPVVRPYVVTAGRVPESGDVDGATLVVAGPPDDGERRWAPEHRAIVAAAQQPHSVADLAAELDLAVSVVRVLLRDLLAEGVMHVYEPPAVEEGPDEGVLQAVVDRLRSL
jgi:hypothetical protein